MNFDALLTCSRKCNFDFDHLCNKKKTTFLYVYRYFIYCFWGWLTSINGVLTCIHANKHTFCPIHGNNNKLQSKSVLIVLICELTFSTHSHAHIYKHTINIFVHCRTFEMDMRQLFVLNKYKLNSSLSVCVFDIMPKSISFQHSIFHFKTYCVIFCITLSYLMCIDRLKW